MNNKQEKQSITRNGKEFYKVNSPYVYYSIDQDGKKSYAYRLYHKETKTNTFVTKGADGKRIKTEKEARTLLATTIDKLQSSIAYKNEEMTIEQVWNDFLDNNNKDEATILKYTSLYNHHIKYEFQNTKLKSLTVTQINTYLENLYYNGDGHGKGNDGYAFSFVNSFYKFFTLILNYAFNSKYLTYENYTLLTNGMAMPLEKDGAGQRAIRVLSGIQIKKIDELLKGTDSYLPFLISLYCGTRPAETYALRFTDFNLYEQEKTVTISRQIVDFKGELMFKNPKTESSKRTIAIPDVLAEAVQDRMLELAELEEKYPNKFAQNIGKVTLAYRKGNNKSVVTDMPADMVCRDRNGKYMPPSSFQYYAKIIRKTICPNNATHEDFSFYTFRKTHLSMMAGNNCPVGELMKRAGHSRIETIYTYYYNSTEASKDMEQKALNMSVKQAQDGTFESDKEFSQDFSIIYNDFHKE